MTRAATVLAPRRAAPRTTDADGGVQYHGTRPGGTLGRRARPFLCAFVVYLAIAAAVWWHLLAHGLGTTLPAGSADPGQEVWFLAWLPHALGTGTNPFFSHAVFSPSGVNLLDNTSIEVLGLLLAPVTVTAGPVAALDVAVLLAPALSALGAFTLCRRYASWSVAAFVGGLCYGFGPFVAGDLRYGHLDLTWLVLPPLILYCLDALLIRRARRPILVGGVLGILVVAQFFVSTEMLAITALTAVVVAIVLSIGWSGSVRPHLVAAWRGLALATAIVVAALAYPFWVVVAGPRHVAGPVWHHIGSIATSLAATVEPHGQLAGVSFISGSNGGYLGIPLLAVLVVGAALLWRSSVLRVTLVTAVVAYVLSLGYDLHVGHRSLHVPLPAAAFGHVPLLDSIVPERFAVMVDLFCGIALALVVDHLRTWARPPARAGRTARARLERRDAAAASLPTRPATGLLVALSVTVGAFALVPFVAVPRWPYPVTSAARATPIGKVLAAEPAVGGGRTASTAPVVAAYPDASPWVSEEMVMQASHGFPFTLADGYAIVPGRGRLAVEAPPIDALWLLFAAGAVHGLHLPLTHTSRRAVRSDLRALGIDNVVVLEKAGGSEAVRGALRETLGPPDRTTGSAELWRTGRTGR